MAGALGKDPRSKKIGRLLSFPWCFFLTYVSPLSKGTRYCIFLRDFRGSEFPLYEILVCLEFPANVKTYALRMSLASFSLREPPTPSPSKFPLFFLTAFSRLKPVFPFPLGRRIHPPMKQSFPYPHPRGYGMSFSPPRRKLPFPPLLSTSELFWTSLPHLTFNFSG